MAQESLRRRIYSNSVVRFGAKGWTLVRTPGALRERPRESLHYLLHSRELSNHTYELSNLDEMAAALAEALEIGGDQLSAYANELLADQELRDALSAGLRTNPRRDDEPRYGKRTMDYGIIRARKPQVVVELGTHDGLGSAVILRALQRNAAEGEDGRLICLDIGEEAGWLVPDELRERMSVQLGDARETLEPLVSEHGVDFFISDIGPYYDGKEWVFETARRHARGELVIRDEFDEITVLREFAGRGGARYAAFEERPQGHFTSGHMIGVAVFLP